MTEEEFQKEAERRYGLKEPTFTAKDIRSKTRQQAFIDGCKFRQEEIGWLERRVRFLENQLNDKEPGCFELGV